MDRYPEFRRNALLRSNLRRCYFHKVFEENKNVFLLQKKIEDAKEANVKTGYEVRNSRFDPEMSDGWDGWSDDKKLTKKQIQTEKRIYRLLLRELQPGASLLSRLH